LAQFNPAAMSTTYTHPTSQHHATSEEWTSTEAMLGWGGFWHATSSCLLELRDRIKLLEATQHAHIEAKSSEAAAVDRVIAPHDQIRDAALICAYARNYIEEYGSHEEADELERIIAALSRRLALDV
jgi:hypothetical protein